MNKIKNFIYLDDYKMYSISSQIFEGMTEYIIKSSNQRTQEQTEQKGPVLSGQVLADIIEKQKDETEKRFLHDYSYTLFENKLLENNKVLEVTKSNIEVQLSKVEDFKFVKITSRIAFNDTKLIEDTVENFNDLGLAFTYITQGGAMKADAEELKKKIELIKDRNQKSNAKQLAKSSMPNLREVASKNNMYWNEEYLSYIKYIINYGYNHQFEIAIPISLESENHALFSAILKREKLKEREIDIIKKYGRLSEKEFTVFGILTQTKNKKEDLMLYKDRNGETIAAMKEAIMNLIFHLSNVESVFTGKLSYEYVIDPIAIYQEL